MKVDYRLKKEKDFNVVFKKGKKLFSNSITMVFFPAKNLKAGFAVSKKHGTAVLRNRIKRLLRESFRSFAPKIGKNFFFVFVPKVADEYSLKTFQKDMDYLLSKGGFYN